MADVKITKPFVIYVEYDAAADVWVASIVGADGLDYVTQGINPTNAVFMAYDALCLVTGMVASEDEG